MLLIFFILLVSGCNESQKELEERCTPVLQKILDIQDERDIIRKDFNVFTKAYQENNENKDLWQAAAKEWLKREGKLLREVNDLYDYSYETGCL